MKKPSEKRDVGPRNTATAENEICIGCIGAIAYLQDEPGWETVDAILVNEINECEIHVVNLIEVYYHFIRAFNEPTAVRSIEDLETAGVVVTRDLSDSLWQDVARLKVFHKVSLADCFCLSLARASGARVLTTDHHEMDALVPFKLADIEFIR